jgi:hypothetical protein
MTNLHNGQIDQASRAAAAILAVHRGYSPKQIGSGLNAVLMVDLNFSATSRRRWERYSAAFVDTGPEERIPDSRPPACAVTSRAPSPPTAASRR